MAADGRWVNDAVDDGKRGQRIIDQFTMCNVGMKYECGAARE
jgi:hypothetical protein